MFERFFFTEGCGSGGGAHLSPLHSLGMVKALRYQRTWRGMYDSPEQPSGHASVDGAFPISPSCGSCTLSQSESSSAQGLCGVQGRVRSQAWRWRNKKEGVFGLPDAHAHPTDASAAAGETYGW